MKSIYVIRKKEKRFVVIEGLRIAQIREKDEEGYGFPDYAYTLREMAEFRSYSMAQSFIDGVEINLSTDDTIEFLKYPTSCCSMGSPGDYPLAEDGLPLYAMINKKPRNE